MVAHYVVCTTQIKQVSSPSHGGLASHIVSSHNDDDDDEEKIEENNDDDDDEEKIEWQFPPVFPAIRLFHKRGYQQKL